MNLPDRVQEISRQPAGPGYPSVQRDRDRPLHADGYRGGWPSCLSVRTGHFQSNDSGWQTCLKQTRYQVKQRRKRLSWLLVVITRYGVQIMVVERSAYCLPDERAQPILVQVDVKENVRILLALWRENSVHSATRKGNIGDGKIGKPFVAFSAHRHQTLASGA